MSERAIEYLMSWTMTVLELIVREMIVVTCWSILDQCLLLGCELCYHYTM